MISVCRWYYYGRKGVGHPTPHWMTHDKLVEAFAAPAIGIFKHWKGLRGFLSILASTLQPEVISDRIFLGASSKGPESF